MMKNISMILMIAVLAACSSCSSDDWSEEDAIANLVRVHSILPPQTPKSTLVMQLNGSNGSKIKVSRIPLVSNMDIVHAESEPYKYDENIYVIKLTLTSLGDNKWRQASASFAGHKTVLIIGEKIKCFVRFEPFFKNGQVKFYCRLSSKEVDKVCSLIKKNYKALVRE